MERTKADVWEAWVEATVLSDIRDVETPDPVRMIDASGPELEMTEAYDAYRLGRGSGDYLYLLYLLEEPVDGPQSIRPVYIGETGSVASRLLEHFRRLRDAVPIGDWEDDGSWGSYGKYDHIATVYEQSTAPLCAWVVDVDDIETGPYGYPTYRHELEGKLVGLAHSYPGFDRVLANRDFVPNRVAQRMGALGPEWVAFDTDEQSEEAMLAGEPPTRDRDGETKADLWEAWVRETIHAELQDESLADPIPLFETDADLTVSLTEIGSSTVFERTAEIDDRIRSEGRKCVDEDGVTDGPNGLLYVLYQLADEDDPGVGDIVPRYIGKAEAYGKKNEVSANFEEIAQNRDGTRSFARWGDGSYWHVGELSETVFGEASKKLSWASELVEDGTHQLTDELYLWVRAWDPAEYPGPYGYPAYLAEVEALLIGLAYDAYPDALLNHKEIPEDAPANRTDFDFEPAPLPKH
ncbi:hypothetical protein [Halarchaeum acidiphilum]|nr:hypothetical protein [Halarchaeum acidiphilum]